MASPQKDLDKSTMEFALGTSKVFGSAGDLIDLGNELVRDGASLTLLPRLREGLALLDRLSVDLGQALAVMENSLDTIMARAEATRDEEG